MLDPHMPPRGRDFRMTPDGQRVRCFASRNMTCWVTSRLLLETEGETLVHDEELAGLTQQINQVLQQAGERNSNPDRHLSLLQTPDGFVLAWVESESVQAQAEQEENWVKSDDQEGLKRALRLKVERDTSNA